MTEECTTPAVDTHRGMSVERFTIWTPLSDEERPLHFSSDKDELYDDKISRHTVGVVLVELGVDNNSHDSVVMDAGRSSELRVLDETIDRLQRIRDALAESSPASRLGQCMSAGNWGRCELSDGHEGAHDFPTEAEWRKSA